ncbi:hypothetical protein [Maritalea sp.]|uniref:hypothetical protein n=1 Tax=Maritalea sp. TaxID=2003361 RepID=UPI003EF1AFC9
MVLEILKNVPVWVWPLLVLLLALGFRATKQRTMPVVLMYFVPLLGVLSVGGMLDLPNPALVWALFAITYGIGALLGFAWQKNWLMSVDGNCVQVKGEWVTMITILIIFSSNFINGFLSALAPELLVQPLLYLGLVVVKGVISGIFAGRAVRVWTFVRNRGRIQNIDLSEHA